LTRKIDNRFPDDEDLSGSVDALLRLQDLYQLKTDEIASGKFYSDPDYKVSMTCKTNVNEYIK